MNRGLMASARKQLLRRGRNLLRAASSTVAAGERPNLLGGIEAAELGELQEIHAALERIERGIFGRCESCSSSIDEAHLERVPWERRCAECRGDQQEEDEEVTLDRTGALSAP
jgi:RNA polymerase-binding transcription factor DksA